MPSPSGLTVGQLAEFSVRQEAALAACEQRRAAVVSIVDQANRRD